ncbi:nitroreductase family protein [Geobacillus subterraneus]|uniref:nitroreductase family protein n=1 Tax=Geobacillus subterraneus TaxID=129338 RepID=UPI00160B667C
MPVVTTPLTKDLFAVIEERKAVRQYDANATISKDELRAILTAATKAPSAWNLQPWHFLVIYGKETQRRLQPIAYGQQQIVDASAVVVVLGDLEANRNTDAVYDPLVREGAMTEEVKRQLAEQIETAYANKQYARDAAFQNAAFAAMQLMLAATAKGWATCPIGGFNPERLKEEFHIPNRYVPTLLITIGKAVAPAHHSIRLPIEAVSTWVEQ